MRSVLAGLKGVLSGMLLAMVSSGILAGSLVLSFTEVGQSFSPAQEASLSLESAFTLPPPPVILPSATATSIPGTTPAPREVARAAASTPTLPPPPTGCPPPDGWSPLTVSPGDTLNRLAETYVTTAEALVQANCLLVSRLVPGSLLYVPGIPPSPPPEPCGPPSGWVFYTVRSGETLYGLGRRLGVSIPELQFANCLGSSTTIRAGQRLYVPFVPPLIPTPTAPPTFTQTASPPPPTSTPVETPTPAPSFTPTAEGTPVKTLPPSVRPASDLSVPARQPGGTFQAFWHGNQPGRNCVIG